MPAGSVLYFPSIEFRNDEWVKSSLLLWDTIYRIVPNGYQPRDSCDVQEACSVGLVRNIVLEPEDLVRARRDFLAFVDGLPFLPAGLESYQESDHVLVHKDKIDKELYPYLEAIAERYRHRWFKLPRELARGYMFHLSNTVAQRRNLVRATDDHNSWVISPYFSEQGNFGERVYDREAPGFYASLILNDLIPASLAHVPMSEVADFVEKHRDLKAAFRESLNAFAEELSTCDSAEFTLQLINDHSTKIERLKTDLRKSMAFCNEDDVSSMLTMGIPVSLTAFGAFAVNGDPYALTKLFGSVLIGAVAAYLDYRKAKRSHRGNPLAAYLVEMDKRLVGNRSYPNYPYLFDQFIND